MKCILQIPLHRDNWPTTTNTKPLTIEAQQKLLDDDDAGVLPSTVRRPPNTGRLLRMRMIGESPPGSRVIPGGSIHVRSASGSFDLNMSSRLSVVTASKNMDVNRKSSSSTWHGRQSSLDDDTQ